MKDVIVEAKVPANQEKGIQEMVAAVSVKYAETIEEAVEMYGAEAILTNAFANWRVTLQSNIRGALKRGETPDAIAERLASAKMGVAVAGGKADPIQSFLASFATKTPEEQAAILADLKAKAAGK